MKTMAIRLDDDVHAQLGMLAQLEELTVADAIRQAIDTFIEAERANPELTARAEAVLADIDRDAATRREAIASLFEGSGPASKAGGEGAPSRPLAPAPREGTRRASRRISLLNPGGGSVVLAATCDHRAPATHTTKRTTNERR